MNEDPKGALGKVIAKAWSDADFKQRLLAERIDPPGLRGHRSGTGHTSGRRWRVAPPSRPSVLRADNADSSTSRMISIFSDAGYLMPRLPHPLSCFF